MAQKRMFDRAIIETDNFLNISLSAKAIYFLLGMEADDEGFVSPNRVIRLYGGEIGDIKNLIDTGLIIPFKSGVVVITHWNENNYLDKNRIKNTQYTEEKKMLDLTEEKKYVLNSCSTRGEERRIEEKSIVENNNEVVASREIAQLIDAFKEVNPFYKKWFANKTQRKSCENMIQLHSLEKILKIVAILPKTNEKKYLPTITTPLQLEDKWSQLESGLKRLSLEKKENPKINVYL